VQQELTNAELILRKLIERAPQEYRAYELYGQVLLATGMEAGAQGDPQAATDAIVQSYQQYRRATELVPSDTEPTTAAGLHQSAGEIASIAGRLDDALDHFQRAGRLDPVNPKHALYEGQILLQQRRLAEARRALHRVLAVDPNEAYAHASLATIALAQDDQVQAIEHIEEARRIAPNDLALRVQEARVRRLCDQPRRALELLVLLTEQERAEEAVASEIASCYRLLGRPTKAAQAWQHRYQLRPDAWRAAARAAQGYLDARQPDEARWWYERARLAAPNSPEVKSLDEAFGRVPDEP
jgi:tetratricopeptide (TPR) repeat protein